MEIKIQAIHFDATEKLQLFINKKELTVPKTVLCITQPELQNRAKKVIRPLRSIQMHLLSLYSVRIAVAKPPLPIKYVLIAVNL